MGKLVTARRIAGLHFAVETGSGHRLDLDGPGEPAAGPRPKELLLAALCGCTGMDVASILQKMRVAYERFELAAEGTAAEEHPRIYTDIALVYRLWGPGLDPEKVRRAVELSWTKYCAVTHMLNKAARMSYQVELNGERIAQGR